MSFKKEVDMNNREAMQRFLLEHFRYNTMNSWNHSTSYACNLKVYNLDVPEGIKCKLHEMLECDEAYEHIFDLINKFNADHDYRWQAAFNGRSGGYLVLYQGACSLSKYKSHCQVCGQKNFASVAETGNMCGRCGQPERIDYSNPLMEYVMYPGKPVDMNEDFEVWGMEELQNRVKLVQEFDALADSIVDEAVYLAENCSVEEEVYFTRKARKILNFGS